MKYRVKKFLKFFSKMNLHSGGMYHSLFLASDKIVWVCGSNHVAQIGLGGEESAEAGPTTNLLQPLNCLPPIVSVAAGAFHSLFLDELGQVWCCGDNKEFQLGTGSDTSINIPETIPDLPPIKLLFAGEHHSMFIDFDDEIWGTGSNVDGQLGMGSETTHYKKSTKLPKFAKIKSISGLTHSLFLDENGEVWGCGANLVGQLGDLAVRRSPIKVNGLPRIMAIAAGLRHSLFLDVDGNVWGCGSNTFGELGDERLATQLQRINLPKIQAIAAGRSHSLFFGQQGNVYFCGLNLGKKRPKERAVRIPKKISGLPKICSISCGNYNSVFVDKRGSPWGFGMSKNGELGHTDSSKPPTLLSKKFHLGIAFEAPFSNENIKSARNII